MPGEYSNHPARLMMKNFFQGGKHLLSIMGIRVIPKLAPLIPQPLLPSVRYP
jgi:hypothetical protein